MVGSSAPAPVAIDLKNGGVGLDGLSRKVDKSERITSVAGAERELNNLTGIAASNATWRDKDDTNWRGYKDVIALFSTAIGGDGGDANSGSGSLVVNPPAGTIFVGNGGEGGVGGNAAAAIRDSALNTGLGNDRISLFATAIGGDGGDANGGSRNTVKNPAGPTIVGNGGQGGDGGGASATIENVSISAGAGNDKISVFATAIAGDGGDANGGNRNTVVNPADTVVVGNGGIGGAGGEAILSISNLSINAGTGNDRISVVSKAVGGDGGDANGGNGNVVKGLAKLAATGTGANGFDITAEIRSVTVDGGAGNDQISISLSANLAAASKSTLASMGTATLMLIDSVFSGGDGNDTFTLSAFSSMSSTKHQALRNKFDGGAGQDTLDMKSWSTGVTVDFNKSALRLAADGTNKVDNIETFIGTKYKDEFVFSADAGATVTGGKGSDMFMLSATAGKEKSYIMDFSTRDGDKLAIDAFSFGQGFAKNSPPLLEIGDLGATDKVRSGSSLIYDNVGSDAGTLYFDATGGTADDAMSLIVLANRPTLTTADILFV